MASFFIGFFQKRVLSHRRHVPVVCGRISWRTAAESPEDLHAVVGPDRLAELAIAVVAAIRLEDETVGGGGVGAGAAVPSRPPADGGAVLVVEEDIVAVGRGGQRVQVAA